MKETKCGFCEKGIINFGKGPRECPYCKGTGKTK